MSNRTSKIWSNWFGNQTFTPNAIVNVQSEADVQQQVATAAKRGQRVRTYGAGHSVTPVVETNDVLLNMDAMKGVLRVDKQNQQAIALPNTSIYEFGDPLWAAGLALKNQGDIDTQKIGGAIATATHGSGKKLQSFSAALAGAKIVDGMGNLHTITRENPDELAALQTSLGLMGIMTEVTVDVAPAYDLHLTHETLYFNEMLARLDTYLDLHRSFIFYWCPTDESAKVWDIGNAKADECAFRIFNEPAPDLDWHNLPADEKVGPSYQVFPLVYEPNFREMEYFVPLNQAQDVLTEVRKLMLRWLPNHFYPLEVRNVAAEEAWMSPHYRRDNLVVSVCGEPGTDYWPYLRAVDSLLAEFDARPHWGKLHFMTAERVEGLFPRYHDFVAMRRRFDPQGTFLNGHFEGLFG